MRAAGCDKRLSAAGAAVHTAGDSRLPGAARPFCIAWPAATDPFCCGAGSHVSGTALSAGASVPGPFSAADNHPSTSCPCLCCRADDAGNELRLPAAAGAGSSITVTYASVLERAAPLARGLPAGILPKACKRCVATTGSCSGDFTGFGTPEFC